MKETNYNKIETMFISESERKRKPTEVDYRKAASLLRDFCIRCKMPECETIAELDKYVRLRIKKKGCVEWTKKGETKMIRANCCTVCGKTFPTRKAVKKYCTKKCKMLALKQQRRKRETLCWDCQNATKCSWSRGVPVPGWNATPTIVKGANEEDIHTYRVISCPEFIEDEDR